MYQRMVKTAIQDGEIRERFSGDCVLGDPRAGVAITGACSRRTSGLTSSSKEGEKEEEKAETDEEPENLPSKWSWTAARQLELVGTGLCMDATSGTERREVELKPCKPDSATQQWLFNMTDTAIWASTGEIRSIAYPSLCISPSLYPFVAGDPPTLKLRTCCGICKQLWQDAALLMPGYPQERPKYPRTDLLELRKPSLRPDGRLVCWVMTNPKNHAGKAKTVADVWGRYCHHFLFVSTEEVEGHQTLKLDLGEKESRDMLWRKSKLAWMHVYNKYLFLDGQSTKLSF